VIKYLVFCLLLLNALVVSAQKKKSEVRLIGSQKTIGFKPNGEDVLKVYKGTFQQENSTLSSDSAYFYPQKNGFDAFGHVHISQGDTLNIYSDKLNYNGNTHIAILTDNVRMIDKDATLTTNYLTYNTQTRIGTYTGGGKLINKDNTLVSKNGYYFAFTRDSYFRYDVVLTTVDAIIKTDTLRYNTGSRIAYFYGPTNIYGKKDKDTLYTENGTYNTITEQAFFGQKNRYSQGTKTLKGDSLFYDRKKGYGRAVKHIIFNDSEQKITLHGDLGTYYKANELTIATIHPWVTMVTEQTDTTKTDSAGKGSGAKKPLFKSPDAKTPPAHTEPVKALSSAAPDTNRKTAAKEPPAHTEPVKALSSEPITDKKQDKKTKKDAEPAIATVPKETTRPRTKLDTIYMVGDTLETQMLTYKELKTLQEERRKAAIRDTSAAARKKAAEAKQTPSKFLTAVKPSEILAPPLNHPDLFGAAKKPQPAVVVTRKPRKLTKSDSLRIARDSVNMTRKIVLSDTARIRTLTAHHHAKIFKSDLQAVADSIFYSSADSTIRCFVKPMIWTQGSQLSGDTIYLQMKNKKLDNMDMFYNAFMVNIEKGDSTHFNQVSGKKMRGFFVDDKLQRIFVDGNAESIYFIRDSTKKITEMHRSLSSRIRANFKNNETTNVTFMTKPEHRYVPIEKVTEDDKILKGFIWKPKDRPVSKEELIPELDKNYVAKRPSTRPSGKPQPKGKTKRGAPANAKSPKSAVDQLKKGLPNVPPALKDSVSKAALRIPKSVKDSVQKEGSKLLPAVMDSVKKHQ
jgi:lipopolysaccharide export system protein LptA